MARYNGDASWKFYLVLLDDKLSKASAEIAYNQDI